MKKYVTPTYKTEVVLTQDIVLASVQDAGQGTVGNITGDKAIFSNSFENLLW